MAILDFFLAFLLVVLVVLFVKIVGMIRQKPAPAKTDIRAAARLHSVKRPSLSEYPGLIDGISATLKSVKASFSSEYIQSLEDTYLSARYSAEAADRERISIREKRRDLEEYSSAIRSRSKVIESLGFAGSEAWSGDKIPDYLKGAEGDLSEILAEVGEIFDINVRGLDDLAQKGPLQSTIYLSSDDASKKMHLRSRIQENLESAEKFLAASREKYDSCMAEEKEAAKH